MDIDKLPHGSPVQFELATVEIVSASPGITCSELDRAVFDRLGLDMSDTEAFATYDTIFDDLIGAYGPCLLVAGDRVVCERAMMAGVVLTHRLTDVERLSDVIDATCDLAGFREFKWLTLESDADDEEEVAVLEGPGGSFAWHGPKGWLDAFEAGSLIAFSVEIDAEPGMATLRSEPADVEPECDIELVTKIRDAYEFAVAEPWLPVDVVDLLAAVILTDQGAFSAATLPLSDLCAAAELEIRGSEAAHEASVWHSRTRLRRLARVMGELGVDSSEVLSVTRIFDDADFASGVGVEMFPEFDGPPTTSSLRDHLKLMSDPKILGIVCDELFDLPDESDPLAERGSGAEPPVEFARLLIDAARTPREIAVARYFAAVCAERMGDPIAAEQHLKLAFEADDRLTLAVDRLAWYASIRGDADRAARLWRPIASLPGVADDLREVEQFVGFGQVRLGRNELCWCGSGRKYKQCHIGAIELAPLPDRVGWLCRKATGFLERQGRSVRDEVVAIATSRALDPSDNRSIIEAFSDPIVIDLALTEGGWFGRFLRECGALLPDDEALLAESWRLVERTVFEVCEVDAGVGLTVRDLRTGETIDVRERAFSQEVQAKTLVCARAVPDGQSHQFIGGLFIVHPGTEAALLDLIDDGEPHSIANWVGRLHRPPKMCNREGEDMVMCEIEVEVDDPEAAKKYLGNVYTSEGASWVETFDLSEVEAIVRAQLALDGSRLTISVNSHERAERTLNTLSDMPGGYRIISDEREEVDVERMGKQAAETRGSDFDGYEPSPEELAVLAELRDQYEVRWCDSPVPALGGITPREAADDPTRREMVDRLIASFERDEPDETDSAAIGMRPARLRELLGL